jgi:hypothetical protein
VLIGLHKVKSTSLRFRIGRCWLIILRIHNDTLLTKFEALFAFFYESFTVENYEMNFTAAEFFLFIIDDEEEGFVKNNHISSTLQHNLKQ